MNKVLILLYILRFATMFALGVVIGQDCNHMIQLSVAIINTIVWNVCGYMEGRDSHYV